MPARRRSLSALALTAALAAAAGCTSGGSPGAAAPVAATAPAPAALAPVTGVRVALEHAEEPAPGAAGAGKVAWRSRWTLTWQPVPGATGYGIHYGTSEGTGGEPREVQPGTSLTVEAAAGTSTRARLDQDRRTGLLLASSQLLVAVSARGSGEPGPRSLWFPVGDVPDSGVPIGTAELGHDEG